MRTTDICPRVRRGSRRRGPATGTLLVLLLALGGPAAAGDLSQVPSTIVLHQAWVRRPAPMGQMEQGSHGGSMVSPDTTAAYVTIQHHGHTPDAVLAASSPIATSSALHATRLQDGIIEMHVQPQFAIPADGRLALRPGDMVPLVLTFRQAGPVAIEAVVK